MVLTGGLSAEGGTLCLVTQVSCPIAMMLSRIAFSQISSLDPCFSMFVSASAILWLAVSFDRRFHSAALRESNLNLHR